MTQDNLGLSEDLKVTEDRQCPYTWVQEDCLETDDGGLIVPFYLSVNGQCCVC